MQRSSACVESSESWPACTSGSTTRRTASKESRRSPSATGRRAGRRLPAAAPGAREREPHPSACLSSLRCSPAPGLCCVARWALVAGAPGAWLLPSGAAGWRCAARRANLWCAAAARSSRRRPAAGPCSEILHPPGGSPRPLFPFLPSGETLVSERIDPPEGGVSSKHPQVVTFVSRRRAEPQRER